MADWLPQIIGGDSTLWIVCIGSGLAVGLFNWLVLSLALDIHKWRERRGKANQTASGPSR